MAKPIPKKLLIHSVTHKTGIHKDTWGNVTYDTTTALNRVRVEPSTKRVMSKENVEVQLAAVVFYDTVNSSPSTAFNTGEVIEFNGKDYTIMAIDSLYDEKRLHHYELGLV